MKTSEITSFGGSLWTATRQNLIYPVIEPLMYTL